MAICKHTTLQLTPSRNATAVGYNQPPPETLLKATTTSTRKVPLDLSALPLTTTFPGPLVLPGDELSHDPRSAPQSLLAWKRLKERNHLTYNRSKLYYLHLPVRSSDATEYQSWSIPRNPETGETSRGLPGIEWEDVVTYLSTFFHPLEVVEYPSAVKISKWAARSQHLSVSSSSGRSAVQVRVRPAPDGDEACYSHQLNLLDILDFAIDILPNDAYALIVFTSKDLYEDDDDDFCIGRAFGGSRVCVVSSARYHTLSEWLAGVEENIGHRHEWPGSHCAEFVEKKCKEAEDDDEEEEEEQPKPRGRKKKATSSKSKSGKNNHAIWTGSSSNHDETPMTRAVTAYMAENTDRILHREKNRSVWLSRVCKTASHELLHCFGVDHCAYYACIMQGTASIIEDTRQPFYLCPIDQAKLREALIESTKEVATIPKDEWESQWCRRMRAMCQSFAEKPLSRGWSPMVAWLDGRMEELDKKHRVDTDFEMAIDFDGTEDKPIEID